MFNNELNCLMGYVHDAYQNNFYEISISIQQTNNRDEEIFLD